MRVSREEEASLLGGAVVLGCLALLLLWQA